MTIVHQVYVDYKFCLPFVFVDFDSDEDTVVSLQS